MSNAAFSANPAAVSGVDAPLVDAGINFAMLDNATYPYAGTVGQRFTLGFLERDRAGNLYRYVRFNTAVAAGDVVVTTEAYLASSMTTANAAGLLGRECGVALVDVPSDVSSSNPYYGWIAVEGIVNVKATTSATANAALCSSATSGTIGSANGTGTKNLPGIVLTQTGQASPTLTTARIVGRIAIGSTN